MMRVLTTAVTALAAVAALTAALAAPTTAAAQDGRSPACAPETPSALRFVDLPSRVPFGREQVFSLDLRRLRLGGQRPDLDHHAEREPDVL